MPTSPKLDVKFETLTLPHITPNKSRLRLLTKFSTGEYLSGSERAELPRLRDYLNDWVIGDAANILFEHLESGEMIFKDEALLEECMTALREWIKNGQRLDFIATEWLGRSIVNAKAVSRVFDVVDVVQEDLRQDVAMPPVSGTIGEK